MSTQLSLRGTVKFIFFSALRALTPTVRAETDLERHCRRQLNYFTSVPPGDT